MKFSFLLIIFATSSLFCNSFCEGFKKENFLKDVDNPSEMTLEKNIANCPFPITEGYMTVRQREQFNQLLSSYGPIRSILEIGLNAGHSAENFFQNCPELEIFASSDICYHSYAPYTFAYFLTKYPNQFVPLIGDSLVTIPEFAKLHPDTKFDLIFIDGNHDYEHCLQDIINCAALAHAETHLWIDDYEYESIIAAVKTAVSMNLIRIEALHEDSVENRIWVEARYLSTLPN